MAAFLFLFFGVKICTVAKFWKIYVTNFHDLKKKKTMDCFGNFQISNC